MFKKRWLISLLGLLAVALLIWFVGPLIAVGGFEPLAGQMTRMIVILVLVVAWGLNNMRGQMQAKKADSQMAENLAAPAPEGGAADSGAEQSEAEVAILKERFQESMDVLKKSARKKGATNLYELPWYIIIGPPGSGKTTALVNSGLNFPLSERFGKEALRGVGGTRNCDWWFTDEAVLLDTAGRYVTQDSHAQADSAAWEGFLGLLKKYRRRRPINGVLVAISVSDLMTQSEHQREAHVRTVKNRIQELHKHLGMRFPVYLMFTKVDLIAGFMEFFDDLGKEDREQVWGTTLAWQGAGALDLESIGPEFDLLIGRLNDRLLTRLTQERDVQRRALINGFPQQVAALKEIVDGFVQGVFRPSSYEEQPLLRGIYFTSGTQEGTPIDRVLGSIARNFGLDAGLLRAFGGQGRSYFITNLLRHVVFQEAGLAGADRRFERQRAWAQRGAYVAALLVSVLAVLAWSTSFTRNQGMVSQMSERIGAYNKTVETPLAGESDFDEILPRLDALRAVAGVYRPYDEGVPLSMGLGLYQGDKLDPAANDAYVRELNTVLVPRMAARIEAQLRANTGDPDFRYEALKTYLMLGDPARLDPELVTLWMQLIWANAFGADAEKRGRLETHLATLLEAGMNPIGLDQDLIRDTRLALTQRPLAELVYGRLKRDYAAEDKKPFRMTDAVGTAGASVLTRASGAPLDEPIPGLFTYRGFFDGYQKHSKLLIAQVRKESWVLGQDRDDLSRAELEQLDKGLLELYLQEYIRVWDELIKDIRIVPFRSTRHATEVLDILSGSNTPVRNVLRALERNTSLTKLPPGMEKAAEVAAAASTGVSRLARLFSKGAEVRDASDKELPGAPVEHHFERLNQLVRSDGGRPPIDRIITLLSDMFGYFTELEGAALSAAKAGGGDIMKRVQVAAARQPEPVKSWLKQLAGGTRTVTVGGAKTQLNAIWGSSVLPACRKALDGRYPFDRSSTQEVPLVDFGRLFGPNGLLDTFFKENVEPFVDTSQAQWRVKTGKGASLKISASTLQQFQRAAVIRDTFFQAGGPGPQVRFGLKPLHLDAGARQFLIDLEGQRFVYRHGPTRVSNAQWPGPEAPSQVRIVFEGKGGKRPSLSADGPWAWFRILDRAQIKRASSDRLIAVFEVGGLKAGYELRASSVVNPFLMPELQEFRCPDHL